MFLVVNTVWTGNVGVWLFFVCGLEIGGCFWAVNSC